MKQPLLLSYDDNYYLQLNYDPYTLILIENKTEKDIAHFLKLKIINSLKNIKN